MENVPTSWSFHCGVRGTNHQVSKQGMSGSETCIRTGSTGRVMDGLGCGNAGLALLNWSVGGDILTIRDQKTSIRRKSIPGNKLRGPKVEMSFAFSSGWCAGNRASEGE